MSDNQKKTTKMFSKRYKIGEFAKYLSVGRDFLKHYEKAGLIQAGYQDNGYRYFDFHQASRLLECMRLRNCGYTVREMSEAFNQSGERAVRSLHCARQAMLQDIRRKEALQAEIEAFEKWFAMRQGQSDDWEITYEEGRYFLPHSDGLKFIEDDRIYEILPQWLEWMPLVKSTLQFSAFGAGPDAGVSQWGLSVRMSDAEKFGIPVNDAVLRFNSCKLLRYHFTGVDRKPLQQRVLDGTSAFYRTLDSLNLEVAGRCLMDVYMSANRQEHCDAYGVICVPVTLKKPVPETEV